jgi:hypothetical protein
MRRSASTGCGHCGRRTVRPPPDPPPVPPSRMRWSATLSAIPAVHWGLAARARPSTRAARSPGAPAPTRLRAPWWLEPGRRRGPRRERHVFTWEISSAVGTSLARAVEVRHEEVAGVVPEQGVQTHQHVPDQIRGDDLRRQQQVGVARAIHALAPPSGNRGHPAARSRREAVVARGAAHRPRWTRSPAPSNRLPADQSRTSAAR